MQRREFIKKGSKALFAAGVANKAPTVLVKKNFTLRVLGTHVTLQEPLRKQAQKDLGIKISFAPGGSAAVLHQAATRPDSFDLYEQWSNSINVLWDAKAIQAIDKKRIPLWEQINPLATTGRLTPEASVGRGDAPYKILHVQKNQKLGPNPTGQVSFLPYVHNVDSFGYNSGVIEKAIPYKTESWAWLLEEKHRGKVAIVNAPTIGLFDLALAAEAKGLMKFVDIGAISRSEINELFRHLIELKKAGHFRGFWSSVPQSVQFMQEEGVVVQSIFSPAVAALNGKGLKCINSSPKEGYRAWHGVMCLSAKTQGQAKDAAYEFMNWWLSGWPGAFIARQGYYISTPHLSKPHLSEDEWNYWYDGKAAKNPLKNTAGQVSVKAGAIRAGGSYQNRFNRVRVWNTVMNSYEYSLSKWNELLLA